MIRHIKPRIESYRLEIEARIMLADLQRALERAKDIGASRTAARIRLAISSAKGAVRAASYRERLTA